MKIVEKNINDLIPYEHNPRRNALAIEPVAKSISKFHFRNPIQIDKNGVVVAGHTRLLAAKKLGIEKVPCIVIDDLTEDEVKAYRIADNKTGEFSSWDDEKLKNELNALSESGFEDIASMGFNEISHMMAAEDESVEEEYTQEPLPSKQIYHDYEKKAEEENIEAYNVIIACMNDEEQEFIKQLFNEQDRLKRFYSASELMSRGLF